MIEWMDALIMDVDEVEVAIGYHKVGAYLGTMRP